MPTATIVAKYVNQPGAGKKNGTVKTPDDTLYLVKPNLLPQLSPGNTYQVEFETFEIRGTNFREIKKIEPVAGAMNGGAPQTSPSGHSTEEHIFVCGLLNQMAAAGNILPDTTTNEVAKVGRWLRAQYREIWKPLAVVKKTTEEDMQDEIPY